MDLFHSAADSLGGSEPLAARMRPRTLDEVVGQDHIVGRGRLLWRAIQADRLSSVIFYGPPGTGKTTIARVIANTTKSSFVSLNAVLAGVKDVREAVDKASERKGLYGQRTILFVDEVHRWNKAQQDALLPWVENGTVVLIGATTENPFFEVNRALVSRSRIFQLRALEEADLLETARRAMADRERGYGKWRVEFQEGALEHLVEVSNGDARSLLNALELAVETSVPAWPPKEGERLLVSMNAAEESIQRKALLYDRDGDYHFDSISAFIKSVRGSDPDGTLYWLAKMVRAGEDPNFLFRRMLISAGEDVGLADPNAMNVVAACAAAFDRVGLPEGHFHLAEAALYLATAPKSNTTLAFFDAMQEVERQDAEVPNHLRDSSRDGQALSHGEGYLYPHAFRDHWVAQQYLPSVLKGRIFYKPSAQGYEGSIRDGILEKRELQAAALLAAEAEDDEEEGLTYSYASKDAEGWMRRLSTTRTGTLKALRDAAFAPLKILRHHRVLVCGADDGLFLWEAARRVPEGLACGTTRTPGAKDALEGYASTIEVLLRPMVVVGGTGRTLVPSRSEADKTFGSPSFELVMVRDPVAAFSVPSGQEAAGEAEHGEVSSACRDAVWAAMELVAPAGTLLLSQTIPGRSSRLSELLAESISDKTLAQDFLAAERAFFRGGAGAHLSWTEEAFQRGLQLALPRTGDSENAEGVPIRLIETEEERRLGAKEQDRWFDASRSPWGKAMLEALGEGGLDAVKEAFRLRTGRGPLTWKSAWALATIKKDT